MKTDLYQWLGNPNAHGGLKDIIQHPLFQKAVAVALGQVSRDLDLQDGNILERAALAHAEEQGARKLIETLEMLSNPPKHMMEQVIDRKPLPEPYAHLRGSVEKHSVV
jgi:hypothetical protein